jgi:phosphoglycerol transferase MdoB-like AlkP superfamily enzyme
LWGADEIKEAMPELSNISETDLGNEWGIFDEYLYTFIEEQIRTSSKPQFFLVLTTSNHPPFEYPSSYQPKKILLKPEIRNKLTVSEDQALKRFTGLQYANQKMSEFLTKVKKSSLSDQTIVGLTGDHSFWIAKGVGQDLEFKRYAVPFYLSIPSKYSPGKVDTAKFGSHEDIFPTLINLALSEKKYVKLGDDLVTEKTDAINNSGLFANEYGAFHHGAFWKWIDLEKQILAPAEATPELLELKNKANGIIGLTDAFLKNEKNRRPSDVKDGQQ